MLTCSATFCLTCLPIADTVVLSHPTPGILSQFADQEKGPQEILEKPETQEDNYRMLLDLNGGVCEVVTGLTLGTPLYDVIPSKVGPDSSSKCIPSSRRQGTR